MSCKKQYLLQSQKTFFIDRFISKPKVIRKQD